MPSLNRRQFLRITAGTLGAGAIASGATSRWWGLDPSRPHDPGTEGDRVVPTSCELCFWKCGLLAHVRDGRVTKLTGNPKHPLSRGHLCPRGAGGTGLLYDPDRLVEPLVRKGERGSESFVPVSWEEALDRTAEGLARIRDTHGPEALVLFTHGMGGSWFRRLVRAYGCSNIAGPSYAQCRGPREAGYLATFGQIIGSPENVDMEHARVIVLIGSHLGENMHNTQVQDFARGIANGAELVVVDPRFSIAAGKARYWLPIRPGTDIALLLAWMHVLLDEGLYDAEYLARHATGLDELKAAVADRTPEWAWPITGIRPDLIRASARLIGGARPASLIHPGRHATWNGQDTQRARAMAILAALLGSWGRRGGYILPSKMKVPPYPAPPLPEEGPALDRPEPGRYPLATEILTQGLCDVSIPGTGDKDVKGWFVYGTNLIQSLPNPEHTREALRGLDFVVAVDVLPSEITGWADVVLPEAVYLERWDDVWAARYREPFVAIRQPVVPPPGNARPGWWIAKELAKRLGLEAWFPWEDAESYVRTRIELAGLDWEAVRRDGVALGEPTPTCEEEGLELAFGTPTGTIELKSTLLEQFGFDAIPEYYPPDPVPPGSFLLLTGRAPVHTFGRTTNNRLLGEFMAENEVWINREAARALPEFAAKPLEQGERVVLVNQDGVRSAPVRVRLTERIRGDCAFLVHGFGHTARGLRFARGRGAADSELITRYATDPIMGGTGMNVNTVRIERPAEGKEVVG